MPIETSSYETRPLCRLPAGGSQQLRWNPKEGSARSGHHPDDSHLIERTGDQPAVGELRARAVTCRRATALFAVSPRLGRGSQRGLIQLVLAFSVQHRVELVENLLGGADHGPHDFLRFLGAQ